jgi:hypothetical protein
MPPTSSRVSTTPRIDSSTGAASVTHPAEMDGSSTDLDYYKALLANVDPHSGEDGLTCHERFGGTWIGRAGQGRAGQGGERRHAEPLEPLG